MSTSTDRAGLLERHSASLEVLEAALTGLGEAELDRSVAAGEWTVRQIIHHVADTEIIAGARLRMMLARDGVPFPTYDQAELARMADPGSRSVESSLALIRAAHQANIELLPALAPAAWSRSLEHEETGRYTVDDWLERRAAHLRGHAEQISAVRSSFPLREG
jgi:hypothetical protein